jgi:chromate transporter
MDTPEKERQVRLKELALLFLRLGATAFGVPAAQIAIMHDETVRRKKWLDDKSFLDLIGAVNLIPGLTRLVRYTSDTPRRVEDS